MTTAPFAQEFLPGPTNIITAVHEEGLPKLSEALSVVQCKLTAVAKDVVGQIGSKQYNYADLDSVWSAIREALKDSGLSIVQTNEIIDGKEYLCTTLLHSSGEHIQGRVPIIVEAEHKGINNMQAYGAAMTYARRYGLSAIIGVSSQEDDDGAGAGDPGQPRQQQQRQPRQQQRQSGNPSDADDKAMCMKFKERPTDKQKGTLKQCGFTWNGEKFRWEALSNNDAARKLANQIVGRQADLLEWHRGITDDGREPAAEDQSDDEQDKQRAADGEDARAGDPMPPSSPNDDHDPAGPGGDPGDPPSPDRQEGDDQDSDIPNYAGLSKPMLLGTVKAMESKLPSPIVDERRPKGLTTMNKDELVNWANTLHGMSEGSAEPEDDDGDF